MFDLRDYTSSKAEQEDNCNDCLCINMSEFIRAVAPYRKTNKIPLQY